MLEITDGAYVTNRDYTSCFNGFPVLKWLFVLGFVGFVSKTAFFVMQTLKL